MLKAISYWAMRESVSGSPKAWWSCWLSWLMASMERRRRSRVHPVGVGDEEDGVALRAALDALVHRREEAAAEDAPPGVGLVAAGEEDDKAGQVLVLAPQPVGHPRAHARTSEARAARLQEKLAGRVVELVGVHRLQDRHLVHDPGEVRQQVRDDGAGVAARLEVRLRAEHLGDALDEREALPFQQRGAGTAGCAASAAPAYSRRARAGTGRRPCGGR